MRPAAADHPVDLACRGRPAGGGHLPGRRMVDADIGHQLGSHLLETLDSAHSEYIAFHIEVVECPYCRANLTDLNRERVRAAGFRCCCSGVPGINLRGADPFALQRIPISPWFVSPHQFGFEVARVCVAALEQQPLHRPAAAC